MPSGIQSAKKGAQSPLAANNDFQDGAEFFEEFDMGGGDQSMAPQFDEDAGNNFMHPANASRPLGEKASDRNEDVFPEYSSQIAPTQASKREVPPLNIPQQQ